MPQYGYGMTAVRILQQRRTRPTNGIALRTTLTGDVWCPTTANHTWLARRHGKVYFTGNSGHGHDDTAMRIAFDRCAGPIRHVDGTAYHLYHLDFDPTLTRGAHITIADAAAQDRNLARLELYRRSHTPQDIRRLTSGWAPTNDWRDRATENDPLAGRYRS